MSENLAAKRLHDLIPAIMQRWDDRVRGEVFPAAGTAEIVLRDSLAQMLEVMAKVLGDQTDPRTAAETWRIRRFMATFGRIRGPDRGTS